MKQHLILLLVVLMVLSVGCGKQAAQPSEPTAAPATVPAIPKASWLPIACPSGPSPPAVAAAVNGALPHCKQNQKSQLHFAADFFCLQTFVCGNSIFPGMNHDFTAYPTAKEVLD